MDIQGTFEQIQQLNSLIYQINKREPAALKVLYRLHRRLFGEEICVDCSNGHIKGFNRLVKLTLADITKMANKEFKLLKGILVEYPFRSGKHYVAETMSDEVAREYLTKHPQMIKNFAQYPKNWDKYTTVTEPDNTNAPPLQAPPPLPKSIAPNKIV